MNLATILDPHPDDAVALISRGKTTTYGQLRSQISALRGGLVGLGIRPRDRVAILCANNWYFVASYFAALSAGAVVVPLNPMSPAVELQRQLAAIGARMIVVGPAGAKTFAAIDRTALPDLEHVVRCEGPSGPLSGGQGDGDGDGDGAASLDDLVGADPVPAVERADDDLAVLIFTSGTAGSARAAMLSHGNLLANLDQVQRHPQRAMTPDDRCLGLLPFFHIFGLNVALGLSLYAGSSVVAVERFDPSSALDTIRNHGITVVPGAPPMWVAWATMPGVDPDAFASVRLAVTGAAKLPEEIARTFEAKFGIGLSEGYGLTEAAPVVTSSAGAAPRYGSIGVPVPGLELRLIDAGGDDAMAGDPGEIWVRGPNVFKGYWEDDEATRAALTADGWLRTGDIAVADDDGYLYLVDRSKDLIIVSGFNVFPAEVEEVLREHPGVAQVAVIGVPHPYTGEAVKAFVVPADGRAVEEDELVDHCASRLARYKCPSKVQFLDELPITPGGKLLRRALR